MRALPPRRGGVVLLALLIAASGVGTAGAAVEVSTLLDLDNRAATGCTVATAAGPLAGIDQVLVATVDDCTSPPQVTSLVRQVCVGGVLGGPVAVAWPYPAPWPAGDRNGNGGANVVEMYLPLSELRNVYTVRLAFTSLRVGTAEADALLTTGGGVGDPAILFQAAEPVPLLSGRALLALLLAVGAAGLLLARRAGAAALPVVALLLAAGVAWAALVLDGDPGDWQAAPCALDPVGDAPPRADITAAYASVEPDALFLRVDVGREAPPAAIDVEKLVNGEDADLPPGPTILVGATVHWSYVVTNTGADPLTEVGVTDNRGVAVTCPRTSLDPGESMTCTASGTALAEQYANVGTATGRTPCAVTVSDADPAHYLGYRPVIALEKLTNGEEADTPPGPTILVGATVQWTYVVTNTGDVKLTPVTVTDDKGVAVSCPKTSLEPGESMTCTGDGTATVGQYTNLGTAMGTPPSGPAVSATDPSHYVGVLPPAIAIEKRTYSQDADVPTGPVVSVGATVQWTYVVTNIGDARLTAVTVTDDKGVAVMCPKTSLDPSESMTCTGSGPAVAGQYANVGTAVGTPPSGPAVSATDPSHYFGAQGCTPGQWQNHTSWWMWTGYSVTQRVDTVFTNVTTFYPTLGNATFLEALGFMGGPGDEGAAEILLRAGVAALLNAAHPNVAYPPTPASVIGDVNAALLGTRATMLTLAAALDAANSRGCPLS